MFLVFLFQTVVQEEGLEIESGETEAEYKTMLSKSSRGGGATDSGFEDERDVDPDDAVELTGKARIILFVGLDHTLLICWITLPADLKNCDFNKKKIKKGFGDPVLRNVTKTVTETL